MNTRLIIRIAVSLLLARWRQTLVAAVGVTFGVTMFIGLLSFMSGLNEMLDGLILNRTPHVRLYNEIRPNDRQPINSATAFQKGHNFIRSVKAGRSREEIHNGDAIVNALRHDDRVAGVARKIAAQVFFNDGAVDLTGVINGIDVDSEIKLFHFDDYVTHGEVMDVKNVPNSIILGKGLAEKLLANIGDVVHVTTARQHRFSLKVVGFFQSGIGEFDKGQTYASIGTTQKILAKPAHYVTDLQIRLRDISVAPSRAREYASLFDCDAEDIQTANAQFETGSFIRSLISYAVGITLLIVAGFGIYNILNMMIYEKMDSIAILKATGFSGRDVNNIFIVIALSIGIFGGGARSWLRLSAGLWH
jgi:lipoprotein-releasing system permease protein